MAASAGFAADGRGAAANPADRQHAAVRSPV